MNPLRRRLAGLPAAPDARRFLFVSLVDAVGGGMFTPISILYLTRVVGLSAGLAGLGLSAAAGVALLATPLAGTLGDRADARTLAVATYVGSGVCFVLYAGVRSFWSFLAVAAAIEVAGALSYTGRRMMIFSLAGETDRVELLAYMRSIRNVGFGVGALLAGAALATGTRVAYIVVLLANAASYLYAGWSLTRMPPAPAPEHPADAPRAGYGAVLRDRLYLALAGVTGTLTLNAAILEIGIALWIVRETSAPTWLVGLLFTLNTVVVVIAQVPASRGSGTPQGVARAYRRAGVALALAVAAFVAAAGRGVALAVLLLVAATVLLTFGEMFTAAAEWAAPTILAPAHLRGRYLGVFRTATQAESMLGPAVVSFALASGGRVGFAALGAGLLAVGLAGSALAARTRAVT